MGPAQAVAQLALATADPSTFTLVIVILGALFTLVIGGFAFTWLTFNESRKGIVKLWEAFTLFSNHDFTKLRDRVSKLEGKLED